MAKLIKGNIVKHRFENKCGKIRETGDAYVVIDWFNGDNDNPCILGELELFCDGRQKESCDKCSIRFNCYIN
jgi:hypothetical protein